MAVDQYNKNDLYSSQCTPVVNFNFSHSDVTFFLFKIFNDNQFLSVKIDATERSTRSKKNDKRKIVHVSLNELRI